MIAEIFLCPCSWMRGIEGYLPAPCAHFLKPQSMRSAALGSSPIPLIKCYVIYRGYSYNALNFLIGIDKSIYSRGHETQNKSSTSRETHDISGNNQYTNRIKPELLTHSKDEDIKYFVSVPLPRLSKIWSLSRHHISTSSCEGSIS